MRVLAGALAGVAARAPMFMVGGVAVGLLLPPLAELFRPAVVPVSVAMVIVSMLRVDPARLVAVLRRPLFVAAAVVLVLLVLPLATGAAAMAAGAPGWLVTGLTYASAAPPLSAAAAYAVLVRADPAMVLGITLPATLLTPLTVGLLTEATPWLGEGVDLSALVLRLTLIVGGAFAAALVLRRLAGPVGMRAFERWADLVIVVLLVAIGIGVMHDVGLALRADPAGWLGLFVLTALLGTVSLLGTVVLFWPVGPDEAFAAGLCAGVKNMAVMVAAVIGTVDQRIALVVITAQLPIYVAPLWMRPLFARLRRARAAP